MICGNSFFQFMAFMKNDLIGKIKVFYDSVYSSEIIGGNIRSIIFCQLIIQIKLLRSQYG